MGGQFLYHPVACYYTKDKYFLLLVQVGVEYKIVVWCVRLYLWVVWGVKSSLDEKIICL